MHLTLQRFVEQRGVPYYPKMNNDDALEAAPHGVGVGSLGEIAQYGGRAAVTAHVEAGSCSGRNAREALAPN
jgi:hypothetical protein